MQFTKCMYPSCESRATNFDSLWQWDADGCDEHWPKMQAVHKSIRDGDLSHIKGKDGKSPFVKES